MFDLEKAIKGWKKSLHKYEVFEDGLIADLELHLRDVYDSQRKKGVNQEEAFRLSVAQVGTAESIAAEYSKNRLARLDRRSPVRLSRLVKKSIEGNIIMNKNYLKIALRNIKRHKGFSMINIAGLAIGMACCFLIYTYVQYELSYDTFHKDYKNIYRVINRQIGNVYLGTDYFSTSPALLAPTMKEDFPEVLEGTRVDTRRGLLSFENKRFNETIHFADPEFIKIFTFPQVSGDLQDPIGKPFSLLITQKMAQKYFGEENPIGNTMRFNNQFDFTVTGVLQDTPLNSHMRFEFLSSLPSAHAMMSGPRVDRYLNRWNSADFHSYIKLEKGTDTEEFQEKLLALKNKHLGEDSPSRFILQSLSSIHLHSHMNMEMEPNSDVRYLYIFSAVGFLIMLIACFNYMNLSTARSSHRAKEVGIRKVVGADRKSIVKQFLSESMISCSIALFAGLLLVNLFLPTFRVVFDRELSFSLFNDPKLIVGLFSITLFMGLLSGSYPAFFLSSFRPIKMLRGNFRLSTKGSSVFRKSLVVIQFFISISLIIGALVIDRQLDFIKNRNLGFEKEHILNVLIQDPVLRSNCQRIKTELIEHPQILDMTVSMHIPVRIRGGSRGAYWEGREEVETLTTYRDWVDEDYFDFYGIDVVKGRNFSKEFPSDRESAYIVNETIANYIGWEDPIGQKFSWSGRPANGEVIGVIRDFHFFALHMPIDGLAIRLNPNGNCLSLKIHPENMDKTIAFIEKQWKELSPEYPFTFAFLDETIDRMYRTEQRLGKGINIFTTIAIFIACLGLFGLASFTAEQKTKEIGIRKILGAPILSIVYLLSHEFLKRVLLAAALATPLSCFVMNMWLRNFAYRININVWTIVISTFLVMFIALITVSYQSLKAATANPVDSLRYE